MAARRPPQSLAALREIAPQRLDDYTNPAGTYAFRTYDNAPANTGPLLSEDILAANLLSLRLGWREVVPLFADGHDAGNALREALDHALTALADSPAFEDHDSTDALEATLKPLAVANEATAGVRGWSAVTVSKVLHRRLPHIVPVVDSRVRRFYASTAQPTLRARLWRDLRDNAAWLRPLAAAYRTPDGRNLSLLRAADIVIWTP